MKNRSRVLALVLTLSVAIPSMSFCHCEIPCGIYDDSLRISLLREDISTIEKSMDEITILSGEQEKNYNQLVRWVSNKEDHAGKFMDIVTQYFMTQRIKPAESADAENFPTYQKSLTLLHQMLVYAMKCKQTVDKTNTSKLRDLVNEFEKLYFQHKH